MTIVLTNDDGINAPGLQTLKKALRDAGHRVAVVAPATNQSGISRAATYHNAVRVRRVSRIELDFAVVGTPVDCVRVALIGQVVPDATLVISGINHGANLGDDIYNSGTVGAAIEAAIHGVPAMAISQQSHPGHFNILDALDQTPLDYRATARLGAVIASRLLENPPEGRCVLNVNTPATVASELEVTRLGARTYERRSLLPVGTSKDTEFYLIYGAPEDPQPGYDGTPGTDFAAVAAGRVAMTAVSYDHGTDPSTHDRWLQHFIEDMGETDR